VQSPGPVSDPRQASGGAGTPTFPPRNITSPNLLGIVLLLFNHGQKWGPLIYRPLNISMSVSDSLEIFKCPISNLQSQLLTLLHFVQTQFNVR
jgi:hypothetical protein